MKVEKTNNVIVFDFKNYNQNKKPQTQSPKINNEKFRTCSFDEFRANRSNIQVAKYIPEIVEYGKSININYTPDEIKKAIENYTKDLEECKDIPEIAEKYKKEFEAKIRNIDFSSIHKIKNFYNDGNYTSKDAVKKALSEETEFDEEGEALPLSQESQTVLENLSEDYLEILKQNYPELKIHYDEENYPNGKKYISAILLEDNNKILAFRLADFINTLRSGSIQGDVACQIILNEDDEYYIQYYYSEDIIHKIDKYNQDLIGCLAIENWDINKKPIIELNDDEGEFGLIFYLNEEHKNTQLMQKMKENFKEVDVDNEDDINRLLSMIQKDEDARKYYENHSLEFLKACVRNGSFNLDIADCMDYILASLPNATRYYISQNHLNNVVNLVEEEDNTFDQDILDFSIDILKLQLKEIEEDESKENFTNTNRHVYKILSFIKENEEYLEHFNKYINSNYLTLDEIATFVDVIEIIKDGYIKEANNRLEYLAQKNKERFGTKDNAIKAYRNYLLDFFK